MPTDQPDELLEQIKKERSQYDTIERQVTGASNRVKVEDQQSNLVDPNMDYNSMEAKSPSNSQKDLKAYKTQATKKSMETPRGPLPTGPAGKEQRSNPSQHSKSPDKKSSSKPPVNRSVAS